MPAPTLGNLTPTGAIGTVRPTLRAVITDPDADNVKGYFQVSTTSNFSNIIHQGYGSTVASGASSAYTIPSDLQSNTTYYWRVFAEDLGGLQSSYSAGQSFTTPAQVSQTFSYTGAEQLWVAPAGVTSITVDAYGAQAGTTYGGTAGPLGGRTQGVLPVTPGETIRFNVGQQPSQPGYQADTPRAFGGGGAGYGSSPGGGGATDVRRGGSALANRVLVAAGAGGTNNNNQAGGAGGGTTGGDGSVGGTGGTQSAGGTGQDSGSPNTAQNGSLGQGGDGSPALAGYSAAGPGGGGGYYGGGGGASAGGGAGGGSALVPSGGSTTAAARSGHGAVTISYNQYNDTTQPAPSAPVVTAPNGGELWNAVHNVTWTAGTGGNGSLKYDVEVSTNNGGAWTRIGTAIVGTSLSYDFTPVAQTSTAKIRVRTVDTLGLASGWDESNAVFTIQHNQAPTAPTLVTPPTNAVLDRAITNRLDWNFNDPDVGDTQSKYDVEWRAAGSSGAWTVTTGITANTFHDIAGGTLAVGDYEWRVRTYDAQGVISPYSSIGYFSAANAPAAPTITSPTNGSTVPVSESQVAWSFPDQTAYQVWVVGDSAGSPNLSDIHYTSGVVVNAGARSHPLSFPINGIYVHVQVAVRDSNNLWTVRTSSRVLISYTTPGDPAITLVPDDFSVSIAVIPNFPAPIGTQPSVTKYDVLRSRRNSEGIWGDLMRIAKDLVPTQPFVDYTPASEEEYRYAVRAYGSNGTSVLSAPQA